MNKNIVVSIVVSLVLGFGMNNAEARGNRGQTMARIGGALVLIGAGVDLLENGGRGGRFGNGGYGRQGRGAAARRIAQNERFMQRQQYDVVDEWDELEGRYIPRVRNIRHTNNYNVTTVSVRGDGW